VHTLTHAYQHYSFSKRNKYEISSKDTCTIQQLTITYSGYLDKSIFSFKEMKLCSACTSKVSRVNYFIFTHLCEINELLYSVLGAREIGIEVQISPGFS